MEVKIILGEDFNIVIDYLWSIGIGTILIGLSYIAKSFFDYKNTRFKTLFELKKTEYSIMKRKLTEMRNSVIGEISPIILGKYNEFPILEIVTAIDKINELYKKESRLFEEKSYLINNNSSIELIDAEKKYRIHMIKDQTELTHKDLHLFLQKQHLLYSEFSKLLYQEFKLIVKKLAKDLDIS
jgi:hypothetical protein